MIPFFAAALILLLAAADDPEFGAPQPVTITGYSGDAMEPFITRDGSILIFNNLNDPPSETDLHWAERIDDLTFAYRGKLQGANSPALDAVATVDSASAAACPARSTSMSRSARMETRSTSRMVISPAERCRRKRISRSQFAAAMDNSTERMALCWPPSTQVRWSTPPVSPRISSSCFLHGLPTASRAFSAARARIDLRPGECHGDSQRSLGLQRLRRSLREGARCTTTRKGTGGWSSSASHAGRRRNGALSGTDHFFLRCEVISPMRRARSESLISVASRRCRVSSCLALIT